MIIQQNTIPYNKYTFCFNIYYSDFQYLCKLSNTNLFIHIFHLTFKHILMYNIFRGGFMNKNTQLAILKKKKKEKKRFITVITVLLLLLCIILLIYLCTINRNKKHVQYLSTLYTPHHDLGVISSTYEKSNNSLIDTCYPTTGKAYIDNLLKSTVTNIQSSFKSATKSKWTMANDDYKSQLKIEYNAFEFDQQYYSITLYVLENALNYSNPSLKVFSYTFNKNSQSIITIKGFFNYKLLSIKNKNLNTLRKQHQ